MFDKSIIQRERYQYNFLPEVQLMIFLGLVLTLSYCVLPIFGSSVKVWGYKDEAIFDIWTVEHVASGMGVAYFAILQRKWFHHPIALLILICVFWELTEHYLETQSFEALMFWFAGTEHWMNRILSDQLAVLLGFTIIKAFPQLISHARVFSICFVGLHIWLGSSMYFH